MRCLDEVVVVVVVVWWAWGGWPSQWLSVACAMYAADQ